MSEIEEKQEDRQEDSGVGEVPGKPGRRKRPSGPVWLLQSERLRNYAAAIAILLGALPAVGSLIVSLVTAYRGEPVAQKTWETLRTRVNKQSEAINKLHLRIVHFQGVQEGQTLSDLQHKLDELQKKYEEAKEKSPAAASQPGSKCRSGQVLAGGRCRSVSRAVNDLVKKKEVELEKARRKALEEKRRRVEEQKERIRQTQKMAKPAPPLLKGLPKHLDEAAAEK